MKQDIIQFRYIRVIACLSIVLLHTLFASNVYFETSMSLTDLTVTRAVENLLMWCVPCFVMVTGALLLEPEKDVPLKKLFSKYIMRMALALVIFTFIFAVFEAVVNGGDIAAAGFFKGWLDDMFTGNSWPHMWYLYMMIGLYAMMPVYKVLFSHASDAALKYITAVMIVFVSVLPLSGITGHESAFYIPTTFIYPAYLFLGRMIYTGQLRVSRHFAVILAIGCSLLIVMLTYFRYMYGDIAVGEDLIPVYDRMLFSYPSILVVGQSIGIFSLLSSIKTKAEAPALLVSMDQCSFGIYLIHMIFLKLVLQVLLVDPYEYGGAWLFAAMAGAFFTAGYIVTFVLRKLPGVKRVL